MSHSLQVQCQDRLGCTVHSLMHVVGVVMLWMIYDDWHVIIILSNRYNWGAQLPTKRRFEAGEQSCLQFCTLDRDLSKIHRYFPYYGRNCFLGLVGVINRHTLTDNICIGASIRFVGSLTTTFTAICITNQGHVGYVGSATNMKTAVRIRNIFSWFQGWQYGFQRLLWENLQFSQPETGPNFRRHINFGKLQEVCHLFPNLL